MSQSGGGAPKSSEGLLWLGDGAYNTSGLLSPSEPHAGLGSSGGGLGYLLLPLETKFLAGPFAGALLKAAFICAGIVHIGSKLSLREQLLQTFGGGFELHAWSELPHGSGLGERVLSPCCPSVASPTPPASPLIPSPTSAQWRERVGQDGARQGCFMSGVFLGTLQARAASWQAQPWPPCRGPRAGWWAPRP